jgi:glycosyltransferase involved in cell wall biosynthesis
MFKRQNAIVSVSEEIRDACQTLTKEKVHYFPNGVDTEKFSPHKSDMIKENYGIPKGSTILITTRRLDRKNNVIELAKAFDVVSDKEEKLYLVIVGDGEQRAEIQKLGNKKIIITGFVKNDEIPNYLNSADIFVIPSLYEATSISCLEAMSCGLPVIGTNVGGLPELIKSNGILCEPNSEALSRAITEMLKSDFQKMGKESRKIAVADYSWDRIVESYITLYKSILKQS